MHMVVVFDNILHTQKKLKIYFSVYFITFMDLVLCKIVTPYLVIMKKVVCLNGMTTK